MDSKTGSSASQPWSPSVTRVLDGLAASPPRPVRSWEVIRPLFELHEEYAEGMAGRLAAEPGPVGGVERLPEEWAALARKETWTPDDSEMHGRALTIGLAKSDVVLREHLAGAGFFDTLARDRFLHLLNNRDKMSPTAGSHRKQGFLALVEGKTGVQPFEDACAAQKYNECWIARYAVGSEPVIPALVRSFMEDLHASWTSVETGTSGISPPKDPVGLLPPPGSLEWSAFPDEKLRSLARRWADQPENPVDAKGLGSFFGMLEKRLQTGMRLVLLAQGSRPGQVGDLPSLGLGEERVRDLLERFPERLAIVVTGVAGDLEVPFGGPVIQRIYAPAATRSGQRFLNDEPSGPDRLEIRDEVEALAEMLALRDLEPPLVVGVLGGWGWGKSFVLHLLEERLRDIRSEDLRSGLFYDEKHEEQTGKMLGTEEKGKEIPRDTPYIGHPYLVRFDAWTYAKSSLWASLVRTLLLDLNRQVALEQRISEVIAESEGKDARGDPRLRGGEELRLLSSLTDRQAEAFTDTEIGRKALEAVRGFDAGSDDGVDQLWERFEEAKGQERKALLEKEGSLAQLRVDLVRKREALEKTVDDELRGKKRRLAWGPFYGTLLDVAGVKLQKELEDRAKETGKEPPSVDDLKSLVTLGTRLRAGISGTSLGFWAFTVVLLVAGIVTARLGSDLGRLFDPALSIVGGALSAVAGMASVINRGSAWFQARKKEYAAALEEAEGKLANERERKIEAKIAESRKRGGDAAGAKPESIPEIEDAIRRTEAEVEVHRTNVGITAAHGSLLDFLKGRLESGFYDEKLGLLHQVQGDLTELTDALCVPPGTKPGTDPLFPRGDPRVFLIVDDLDRCPPERVVEVLEAAQLLVKTKLFVVVLAMDVRYITRALEKTYDGVLVHDGAPSGLDYLEKIVQVPYRVRPIQPEAMRGYLSSQIVLEQSPREEGRQEGDGTEDKADRTDPADDRTGGETGDRAEGRSRGEVRPLPSRTLDFREEELSLLETCGNAVVVSPRSAKRLVNVVKLLKIVWERRGLEAGPPLPVKQVMVLLLTLSVRHPEVLRSLLRRLEDFGARTGRRERVVLRDLLTRWCDEVALDDPRANEWERVKCLIQDARLFPEMITLGEVGRRNIRLVSSFSFLGDADPEVEEKRDGEGTGDFRYP